MAAPVCRQTMRRPCQSYMVMLIWAALLGMGSKTWSVPQTRARVAQAERPVLGISAAASLRRPNTRLARAAEAGGAIEGARVGVLHMPGMGKDLLKPFEKFNVTNETFFQTEVPDAFQFPLAAKMLAMSQTVDVIVACHGNPGAEKDEILRGYQSVALTTNVPVVPCDGLDGLGKAADTAVQMAEIRQQALSGGGPRKSIFFGIGSNKTAAGDKKKGKIYF
eukprot:TRINITY_DN102103_c0_g1_i1.p1 TRINITY_DN102103_c0_g1~~TRINITY_DN102103_c0_g1_i1.p1  ORF type:complete len:221 (+),score=38.41 TRINITY_DN102103_c0_g1_i1:74-736(+)